MDKRKDGRAPAFVVEQVRTRRRVAACATMARAYEVFDQLTPLLGPLTVRMALVEEAELRAPPAGARAPGRG